MTIIGGVRGKHFIGRGPWARAHKCGPARLDVPVRRSELPLAPPYPVVRTQQAFFMWPRRLRLVRVTMAGAVDAPRLMPRSTVPFHHFVSWIDFFVFASETSSLSHEARMPLSSGVTLS